MSTSLPTVYFVRHGETEWSRDGRHTGSTDLPLTAHGETMARALRAFLADTHFTRVLTSPMQRARVTCKLAGLGALAEISSDLSEWNYGDYEGRSSADITKGTPGWNVFADGCPGGETTTQISQRADRLIADLLSLGGNIALFSHGQFGCVLAARWIGLAVVEGEHFTLDAASVSVFGPKPGHAQTRAILQWNVGARSAARPTAAAASAMTDPAFVTHIPVALRSDPTRVVIRPFMPADDQPPFIDPDRSRAQRVTDRVLGIGTPDVGPQLRRVTDSLSCHHRDVPKVLLRRFHGVNGPIIDPRSIDTDQSLLIGAYFSEEYSFEAAALFNPSIVLHPDQTGVPKQAVRFILSLRGLGEGNISSATFRTGLWSGDVLTIDPPSVEAISPRIEFIPGGEPDDPGVRLFCEDARDLSEIVIFPVTPAQRHGIEDLRLVRFIDDDGNATYLGTYTAFSGGRIRQEILRTTDFVTIDLHALRGPGTDNKGMALFPRKINGRYAMLGRQDHENIWLQMSDDIYTWEAGVKVVEPRWPWEFVQIGNCGSPIEIDEGWLVITHGVGAVRNYCLGACLLDKADPSKLLARLADPLLRPDSGDHGGYVPNVLYSCGAMVHQRTLLLPYAIADSFTTFAKMPLDQLLAAMR